MSLSKKKNHVAEGKVAEGIAPSVVGVPELPGIQPMFPGRRFAEIVTPQCTEPHLAAEPPG